MADLTEKIEWLQRNDHLAQRIANNAKNFGTSYLRLEDVFCYALTALQVLSKLANGSDVTKPFHARKLQEIHW